ncbi:hypothetical protein GCM10017044_12600 [Kordiimonas sediminis]|uniref:Response regulatory domain-containing protein n=1 Tax=Kordiimonas sediminis TaxID=1735581 RepID=A0A919AS62_9PROT|nr:response regulator transcription factor [Kordiimonas sediminis]GHF19436.1 hypothetical protein GCM10017044_12600 [Kordiimonas sediminis]
MNYRNARIHVIVSESGIRFLLRDLLREVGFTDIYLGSNFDEIKISVTENHTDLLIVGASFPDGDPLGVIEDIRQQRLGRNPFLAMMAISSEPTKQLVKKVADSGADDLLVYPLSLAHLKHRIDVLVEKRKQFLVTSNYMGPDRRAPGSFREGSETVPLFDAPNVLRAQIKEDISLAELERQIKSSIEKVAGYQFDRDVRQICWLIDRIVAGYNWAGGGLLEPHVGDFLLQLLKITKRTCETLDEGAHPQFKYLCDTTLTVASRMFQKKENAEQKDLLLLPEMSRALKATINMDTSAKAAREIQSMIKSA